MNKTTITLALLGLWASATSTFAQNISTANPTINCGQIAFQQPLKAEFMLKNSGDQPLIINTVRSSCGCTTADYPKEAVAPGQSFKVSATYDAKQMGHFQKQLAVYSNAGEQPFVLTLKGVVVERVKNFKGLYPYTIGALRTDTNEVEFNDVNRGDMPIVKIHLFNDSDQMVEPQLMHLPAYLRGEVKPTRIAPGTGVMKEHFGATSSNFTSPLRRKPFFFVASGTRVVPTSMITAPSFTISAVTKSGRPIAAMMISASRHSALMSLV